VEPRYIACWLSIYFGISSSSLLQVALIDHVVRIQCAAPIDPIVGASSLEMVQTNSPTLARWDGLRYIRIWVTPPRGLVFWDGAPSPYKWYQSHAPNLVMYGKSPNSGWRSPGCRRRHRCSERHSAAQRKNAGTGTGTVQ